MVRNLKPNIALDVDDVLMPCNEFALELINKHRLEPLKLEQITKWGRCGTDIDEIFDYYEKKSFWEMQPCYPGAQEFVSKLAKFGNVFITTAIKPEFMGIRAEKIMTLFSEIPPENIIMGARKDMYQFDFVLDDAPHNISASAATYPILVRQPWNANMSGMLAVNSYDEAINMINSIMQPKDIDGKSAKIICIVGPTGCGKTQLTEQLCEKFPLSFKRPVSDSTALKKGYHVISEKEFYIKKKNNDFLETSVYGGHHYGLEKASIDEIIQSGKRCVMPVDICGAMAVKMHYPETSILFINRDKKDVITDILNRDISNEDKTSRLISLNDEYKNINYCDHVINYFSSESVFGDFIHSYCSL